MTPPRHVNAPSKLSTVTVSHRTEANYLLLRKPRLSTAVRTQPYIIYIVLKRNLEGKINNVVERLSDGGPQQAPVFSPDGNMVAFVRDNNIYLVKLLYNTVKAKSRKTANATAY